MELQRRAGNVFRFRRCHEVTQMPQFHSKTSMPFGLAEARNMDLHKIGIPDGSYQHENLN